jgi:rSAM/selenodomain-associated transferase 1
MGSRWVVLLTKAPVPGEVKTRLGRQIGMAEAASLAEALLADSLAVAASGAEAANARLAIVHAPDRLSGGFERWLRDRVPTAELVPQGSGDLGERLAAALDRFEGQRVALGSDSPDLPPARISEAFEALGGSEAVLGPTGDGGYYLVGLCGSASPLRSGIRWSSVHTLADTLAALGGAALLAGHDDVDDLVALRALVARRGGAPATRAWLEGRPGLLR